VNIALIHDSEDMISLLGKRPFVGRSDDMDKWLDENRGEKSAPPPLESLPPTEVDGPMPTPAPICAKLDDKFIL